VSDANPREDPTDETRSAAMDLHTSRTASRPPFGKQIRNQLQTKHHTSYTHHTSAPHYVPITKNHAMAVPRPVLIRPTTSTHTRDDEASRPNRRNEIRGNGSTLAVLLHGHPLGSKSGTNYKPHTTPQTHTTRQRRTMRRSRRTTMVVPRPVLIRSTTNTKHPQTP